MQDPTEHIQQGAQRVCDHFRGRPQRVLEMTDEARKIELGCLALHTSLLQSTWSTASFHDLALCPGFSGNQVSGRSLAHQCCRAGRRPGCLRCYAREAGGGGRFDGNGQLLITVQHVQAFRLLILLPDVSLTLGLHRIPGQCMLHCAS